MSIPLDAQLYRRRSDGQLGFLRPDGQIQLDRAAQVLLCPLTPEWIHEARQKPLSPFEVAQVCWAADVIACRFLGVQQRTKDWISLTDEQRIDFSENGPPEKPAEHYELRKAIYDNLRGGLHEFTRDR
jgi:hypothetical protein